MPPKIQFRLESAGKEEKAGHLCPQRQGHLTLVQHSKSLGLIDAIREEIQNDKIQRDIERQRRAAPPTEPDQDAVGVASSTMSAESLISNRVKLKWMREAPGTRMVQ